MTFNFNAVSRVRLRVKIFSAHGNQVIRQLTCAHIGCACGCLSHSTEFTFSSMGNFLISERQVTVQGGVLDINPFYAFSLCTGQLVNANLAQVQASFQRG